MFRRTGKQGEVKVDPDFIGPGVIAAMLYDFDFDDVDMKTNVLKPAHAQFLDQRVLPLLKADRGQVWIAGSASRIGESTYNIGLSQVRMGRVAQFLLSRGVKQQQMREDAIGEARAATHRLDDPRDRSVEVFVMPKTKYDPPPPRHVPSKPKLSRKFKISMLTGFSASWALKTLSKVGGLAADLISFVIWDTTNNLSCLYVYWGPGVGLGLNLPFGTPISGTTHGPWNLFHTSEPMSVEQFGTGSDFFSMSFPIRDPLDFLSDQPFSRSRISIETPTGVSNVHEWINTGLTIGAGISQTIGDFRRIEGPSPFFGP